MNKTLKHGCIAALVVIASAGSALAADLPKEGTYDFIACQAGVVTPIAFSKEYQAFSYEQFGSALSKVPGGLFDKATFHCMGLRTRFNGKETNNTVCENILPDGEKTLSTFSLKADGTYDRQFVAGTGKYEGMISSGTTESLGPFPTIKAGTFQFCNHQTGTYKLK